MAKIKSFTDLQQSRKLAEILPLESADNYYSWHDERYYVVNKDCPYPYSLKAKIPCWSLTALLEVLKQHCERLETTLRLNKNYNVFASGDGFTYRSFDEYPDGISNLIDAYYKIVIRLNELNLL